MKHIKIVGSDHMLDATSARPFDIVVARKMLAKAFNEATLETERSVCISKFNAMLDEAELQFDNLTFSHGGSKNDAHPIECDQQLLKLQIEIASIRSQNSMLRAKVKETQDNAERELAASIDLSVNLIKAQFESRIRELASKIAEQNQEIEYLRGDISRFGTADAEYYPALPDRCGDSDLEDVSSDAYQSECVSDNNASYVNFHEIQTEMVRQRGHFCKSELAFLLNMPIAEMNAWQKVGIFPAGRAIFGKVVLSRKPIPTSRKPWTDDEVRHLKSILDGGATDLEAARQTSRIFGRAVYETGIINRRRALFREQGWLPKNRRRFAEQIRSKRK